jgi:hypothetical protein
MSDPRHDKMLSHLLWNISLLAQHEGLQNAGGGITRPFLQKAADLISPAFHVEKEGVPEPFANLHTGGFLEGESHGMNSLEGQVAFIGKSSRVMKSPGWIKSTPNPEAIPRAKRLHFVFEEEEDAAPDRDGALPQDDLIRVDQQLGPTFRTERRTKDRSLQGDSIQSVKSGEGIRRGSRSKVFLNRKDPKEKEEKEGHP